MNTNLVRTSYCVFLAFISFIAKGQPIPDFTATPRSGCAPLHVNFTDLSSGNPTQWKWDLGNGTISFLRNPSVTYLAPGAYTVKLVVQNAQGKDSVSRAAYINVYGTPEVNFSASALTGCAPAAIQFTDLTSTVYGANVQWEWDFGDGNISGDQNPSHTYTAPGTYNVSLRVTNVHGCTKTITRQQYISITPPLTAGFSFQVPQGCNVSNTVTFQNLSTGTGINSYTWDFGDGTTSNDANPVHSFANSGTYNVMLTVITNAGCTATYQVQGGIVIGSVNAMIGAPDSVCINTPVTFLNNSVPVAISSLWTFEDGTISTQANPVRTYPVPGTYQVQLVSDFGGCFDTTTRTITVTDRPVAGFNSSATASCAAPITVTFNNTSTGAQSYLWLFGDGTTSTSASPVHTYTAEGSFTVKLIAYSSSGCSDTITVSNAINIKGAQASITISPVEGCAPLQVQFNSSVTSTSPVTSYQWDLGNGVTSNISNPSNVYDSGVYDIRLIIVTADGCTDTVTRNQAVRAGIKPNTAFSASPTRACAYTPISFTDLTTGNPDKWLWDFGDGGTSTQQNPQHIYGDTGYFRIRLITWNNGCADTLEIPDYIYIDPPIAKFSIAFNCEEPYKRRFTDQSIGAHTWHWDFGDGSTSTAQNPVHIYNSPGTYQVILTVTNNTSGCIFQETKEVWIIDESAQFNTSASTVCRNQPVTFTGLAAPGNLSSYNWDFGDGTTGFGHWVTHSYSQAGTYSVRLIIVDQHGCADTLVKPNHITVNGPTAAFAVDNSNYCTAATVTFNDNSTTDGTHPITSWTWNFGDGTILTHSSGPFSHAYQNTGSYNVSLSVTDNSGCTDQVTHTNLVNISKPVAAFQSERLICIGNTISFQNNSQAQTPSYQWNFGDGNTSTASSPVHTYTSAGVFSVQLIITEPSGCSDTLLMQNHITVNDPQVNFVASDTFGTCPPLVVNFQNSSSGYDSFHWDFGDGTSSNTLSPTHFYSFPGTFVARLTITAEGGCVRTKEQTIVVKGPTGNFSYDNLSGCLPHNVNFNAVTQNNVSLIWDFSDGNTMATPNTSVSHTYITPGTYVPKMILIDEGGCTVAVQGPDTIRVDGISAVAGFNQQLYCGSGEVQFNSTINSTSPIQSILWNFGDGATSTDEDPVHVYSSPGEYVPSMIITSAAGCTDTVYLNVPVVINPRPDVAVMPVDAACAPLQTTLQAQVNLNSGIISYEWTTGNGSVLNGITSGNVTYDEPGNYYATLTVTDSLGCRDTASTIITVHAIPQVNAGVNSTVCLGSTFQLNATGALNYSWNASSTLSCTDCASPVATPAQNITYHVTGSNAAGCSSTDSVSLTIIQPFDMIASRGDSLCAGGNLTLTASGADHYQWTPSTGLNNSTAATVIASPRQTIVYSVIGSDAHGCFRDTMQIPVTVFPIPQVEAGEDITINAGQMADLVPQLSPDVTSVTWTPTGSIFRSEYPAITVKPGETTTYRVEVENAGGCRAADNLTVHVICNNANVFIPNTFSPNGDGNNDVFYPRGSGLFNIRSFRIYNRWGELVFEKNNVTPNSYSSGWDGTYKGKTLSPDVFVYIAEIVCENKTIMPMKGNVALIR